MNCLFPRLGGWLRRACFRTEPHHPALQRPPPPPPPPLLVYYPFSLSLIFLWASLCTPLHHIRLPWTHQKSWQVHPVLKPAPSPFCMCPLLPSAFRTFQFVLTYCDCIGLTSSLIPVCTFECVSYLCNNNNVEFLHISNNLEQSRQTFATSSCSCAWRKRNVIIAVAMMNTRGKNYICKYYLSRSW